MNQKVLSDWQIKNYLDISGNIGATMSLNELIEKQVNVITTDGRNIVGILKGYDQVQNLILCESHERVFSEQSGVIQQPLGLYIIRGDTM